MKRQPHPELNFTKNFRPSVRDYVRTMMQFGMSKEKILEEVRKLEKPKAIGGGK